MSPPSTNRHKEKFINMYQYLLVKNRFINCNQILRSGHLTLLCKSLSYVKFFIDIFRSIERVLGARASKTSNPISRLNLSGN